MDISLTGIFIVYHELMLDRTLDAFSNYMKLKLPQGRVKTFLTNHPQPNVELVYPALCIVPLSPKRTVYAPRPVGTRTLTKEVDGNTINVKETDYINGEFTSTIMVHYYGSTKDDRADFIETFYTLFAESQVFEGQDTSLSIPYGALNYERCNLTIVDYHFTTDSEAIRSEEIKVIFEVLLDYPSVLKTQVSEVTEVQILKDQSEIGEKVRPEQ